MRIVYADAREAQVAVWEIAQVLTLLSDRLEEVAGGIARPPGAEAMLEGLRPMTVAADLREAIECALLDHLRPALRKLDRAARATEESLRQAFEEQLEPRAEGR